MKRLCDFIARRNLRQGCTKFVSHRHCGSGDIMILVCQMISKDYLVKSLCDFLTRNPSK